MLKRLSQADDKVRSFFLRAQPRLAATEKWLLAILVGVWVASLTVDTWLTLAHVDHPRFEGNLPLSRLMERYGVKEALAIGIAFHIALAAFWAGLSWVLGHLVWRLQQIRIPLYRFVPFFLFLLRDTWEHVYGAFTWL